MFLAAVLSLGIPHVLYVVAWLLLLGRAGPVNELIGLIRGAGEGPTLDVYSMWGMILIEGVGFAPLTFLLMSAVLRSTDASFEEAAMMSGAGPLLTFRTITLRMGLPGVLALLLLVFIRAFELFEVPALVGPGRQRLGADHQHLSELEEFQHAELRRVRRLFGLPAADRGAAADLAPSAVAPCASLPDHHRQGLPAARHRSRPRALCRGGVAARDLHAGDGAAGRHAGVRLAAAVLRRD